MSRDQALEYIPARNPEIKEVRLTGGLVRLEYFERVKWASGLLKKLNKGREAGHLRRIELDELGTTVWDLMDGKRSVREIIDSFGEQYSLHPQEAETSVSQFIRTLGRRGMIGLGRQEEPV